VKAGFGPFKKNEQHENRATERRRIKRSLINHNRDRQEWAAYCNARVRRLQIVTTSTTPCGQAIDWISIEYRIAERDSESRMPSPASSPK
jgi:hypothetical protein